MAKNYSKIYAEHFGIKWDKKKFDVHHIDGDRENNSIDNLVLLPKELHIGLHKLKFNLKYFKHNYFDFDTFEKKMLNGISEFESEYTIDYLNFSHKLIFWGYLKANAYRKPLGGIIDLESFNVGQDEW